MNSFNSHTRPKNYEEGAIISHILQTIEETV